MTGYKQIRRSMRENEIALLSHLRQNRVTTVVMWGNGWHGALERLEKSGRVKFRNGIYTVKKGAGPVTPAVRN